MIRLELGSAAEVLSRLQPNSVDAVITDPPSGSGMIKAFQPSGSDRYLGFDTPLGKLRHNFKTVAAVNLRLRKAFERDHWPVFAECARVLKPGGYFCAWGFGRTQHWVAYGAEDAGLAVLDPIIRRVVRRRPKATLMDERSAQLQQETESWILARKPGETTASATVKKWGTGLMQAVAPDGSRYTNLFYGYERNQKVTSHPNEKDLKWMRLLVRVLSPPDSIVLDPYMGSGTTGVAAQQEGRGFIGIESDPAFFTLASSRLGS